MLIGTVVSEDGSLTVPIPENFENYVIKALASPTENGETLIITNLLGESCRAKVGASLAISGSVFNVVNYSFTRSAEKIVFKGTNANTTGKFIAGKEYEYTAW